MRRANDCFTVIGACLLGITIFSACGNGGHPASRDGLVTDTASFGRDTAPGAEIPPGAINPGEDSARYGTGQQDTSKNRTMQK